MIAELPEFVIDSNDESLTIRLSDVFDEVKNVVVTIEDVVEFFRTQSHSMSGCRTLAGEIGDWRPMSELAQYCLDYFKSTNVEKLREVSIANGLTPKF